MQLAKGDRQLLEHLATDHADGHALIGDVRQYMVDTTVNLLGYNIGKAILIGCPVTGDFLAYLVLGGGLIFSTFLLQS